MREFISVIPDSLSQQLNWRLCGRQNHLKSWNMPNCSYFDFNETVCAQMVHGKWCFVKSWFWLLVQVIDSKCRSFHFLLTTLDWFTSWKRGSLWVFQTLNVFILFTPWVLYISNANLSCYIWKSLIQTLPLFCAYETWLQVTFSPVNFFFNLRFGFQGMYQL